MAVLNFKALSNNPKWKGLNTSARLLFQTIASLTNKDGFGCIVSSFLMKAAGIGSWTTVQKGKKALGKVGLIKMTKYWALVKENGRVRPKAYITYQVLESVVWKKDGNIAPSMPKSQSTLYETPFRRILEDTNKKIKEDKLAKITPKRKKGIVDNPLEAFINELMDERQRQGSKIKNREAYKQKLLEEYLPEYQEIKGLARKMEQLEELHNSERPRDWDKAYRKTALIEKQLEEYDPKLVKLVRQELCD